MHHLDIYSVLVVAILVSVNIQHYLIIEKHDLIYITRTLKNILLLSKCLDRRLYLKDGCNNCDIIHWLKPWVFWRLPSFLKKTCGSVLALFLTLMKTIIY